jgi:signal transduction histidine kinase
VDLYRARRENIVTFVDAREALTAIMGDRFPDERRFRRTVGDIIERSVDGRSDVRVRAYGELVDVLWREGNAPAAIRLEELWNELAEKLPFSLLCAYAMGNFYRASDSDPFSDVLALHRNVHPSESFATDADADTRFRQIAVLQQRERALQAELDQRRSLEAALRDALAERRRAEEELRSARDQAEHANRVKSEFLAIVSHELRTPLNAILGFEDLLAHEVSGPLNSTQRDYLARIRTGADQLLHVIDQILRLSRIEAGKEDISLETVDLTALVRQTAALLEPAVLRKNLTMEIIAPDAIRCDTDSGKLRQILLNLLSNAVKFTTVGGLVLRVERHDADVLIHVADTGEGIRATDIDRIFEPFTQVDGSATRRHGGTGLGLPVSRELARMLRGDLTVHSLPGEGSVFTLRIPATHAVATVPRVS